MRLLLCTALQKLKPSLVHKADNTPIFSELLRNSCPTPQGAGFLMYISSDLHIVPSVEPICCHLSRTGRQKAVYQNMSTVICRPCHYHSQFWGVSHENTRLLSFLRLWPNAGQKQHSFKYLVCRRSGRVARAVGGLDAETRLSQSLWDDAIYTEEIRPTLSHPLR